jgi:hypothetical protein
LKSMTSYLGFKTKIDCKVTSDKLTDLGFQYPDINVPYIKRLLDYAVKMKYLKK